MNKQSIPLWKKVQLKKQAKAKRKKEREWRVERGLSPKKKKKRGCSENERLRRDAERKEHFLTLEKNKYKHYDSREDHLDSIQAEIKNNK